MSHESLPKFESKNNLPTDAEARRHQERLKEKIESSAEKVGNDNKAEAEARREIHETAISAAEYSPSTGEDMAVKQAVVKTKAEKSRSFNTTMHHVRKNMNIVDRTVSKVIHTPAVEKTSEVIGKTVARPSGLLGASVASFIGLLLIFGVAKYAGFQLSGSEMPLLLLIGLVLGLLTEWVFKSVQSVLKTRSK